MTAPPSRLSANGNGRPRPNGAAPAGRALVLAVDAGRAQTLASLAALGYAAEEAADPYAAVARLAAERGAFSTLVLSLAAVLPEELALIGTVKSRLGPLEVTVCDVDGRGASFGEAMRHGADALLAGGHLHRMTPAEATPLRDDPREVPDTPALNNDASLTPDELRALLDDE